MVALEHAGLLEIKAERFPLRPQGVDPIIERPVEVNVVAMPRQQRRHLALDRLDRIVAVGRGEIEEDRRHPIERAPAAFQGLDGVGEARRVGIGRDGRDVLARPIERRIEGGAELGGLDGREGRRFERPCPGSEQGIVGLGFGHVASVRRHLGPAGGAGKTQRAEPPGESVVETSFSRV